MKIIKDIFISVTEEHKRRRDEFDRLERERNEEEARKEREKIQRQIGALMAMSEKEILVKIILEMERLNSRLDHIEKMQKESKCIMDSMDSRIIMQNISIDELKYK